MKKLQNAEPEATEDFFYDLFMWWYFSPSKFIEWKEDIEKIENAIQVINEYGIFLESEWLIEEM